MASSSSKPKFSTETAEPNALARLPRLLSAIADELIRTAEDVVRLGEVVSHAASSADQPEISCDLQAFDIFSQTALAQAQLLKRLAESNKDLSSSEIAALIEEIPFATIRKRLHDASAGITSDETPIADDDAGLVSWFQPPGIEK